MVGLVEATPSISDVAINPTIPQSYDNLTVSIIASDTDGLNITNIYNWYKDGDLNMTTLLTPNELMFYLPLNNDTLDYWGTNNGTCSGGDACPTLNNTGGKIDGAYIFDGITNHDHIDLNSTLMEETFEETESLSISVWVYPTFPTSDSNNRRIISCQNHWNSNPWYNNLGGFSIWYNNINGWTFGLRDQPTGGQKTVAKLPVGTFNTWHHIVATYDGSDMYIYVDGVKSSAGTSASGGIYMTTYPAQIGGVWVHTVSEYQSIWNGTIDEVILYNKTLSDEEVLQLYYGGLWRGDVVDSSQTTAGEEWTAGPIALTFNESSSQVNDTVIIGGIIPPVFDTINLQNIFIVPFIKLNMINFNNTPYVKLNESNIFN